MSYRLIIGDALTVLKTLPSESVHCAITSPPYFGLRSYLPSDHPDKASELGGEQTPEQYVARLVEVFAEVKRVLHSSGVLFLNLGDSYYNYRPGAQARIGPMTQLSKPYQEVEGVGKRNNIIPGLKEKDLIGIPWMTAFALRADGWYLRSAITWCKGNPMPESVTDRCTSATEMVFMLAKNERYFYDQEAIKEKSVSDHPSGNGYKRDARMSYRDDNGARGSDDQWQNVGGTRNKRNWWLVNSEPYPGSHYATFPTKLVEPMILSASSAHGCCEKCLSPYERVVERVGTIAPTTTAERMETYLRRKNAQAMRNRRDDGKNTGFVGDSLGSVYETLGWQPTCSCQAPVQPCTVLDPFFGSGTTAKVALTHGRNFIGIDLDARNLELATQRIEQTQPLLLQEIA